MTTQPARGMRDFLPEDVRRREYVVGTVRNVYDRYGFEFVGTYAFMVGTHADEDHVMRLALEDAHVG